MRHIKYQPEIDGLRAIAILSVIVFHANEFWLPGGFVGVDVFFVISGYLIATILMHNNTMPPREFLRKRVKRILPAYLVVLLAVLSVGGVIMPSEALYQLSKEAASALFQVTNITSLSKAPYFSVSSIEKPLLHTWSLAVEWQFYLMVAAVLWVANKAWFKPNVIALLILGLGSFFCSTFFAVSPGWESHAYYNFISRFWEFAVGALTAYACFFSQSKYLRAATYLGACCIAISFIVVDESVAFPGYWALLPVLGTAGVIYGSQQESFIKTLLASRVLVFVGKISYSLYLWHWPVFAFWRYITNHRELGAYEVCLSLLCTLVLSLWSYFYIENMGRDKPVIKFTKLTFFIIFILCLALIVSRGGGKFQERNEDYFETEIGCGTNADNSCGDTTSETQVLLIGDSHAGHLGAAFDQLGKAKSWNINILSSWGCAPVFSDHEDYVVPPQRGTVPCEEQRRFLQEASKKYEKIFVAARWEMHFKKNDFLLELEASLRHLSGDKAEIYVLGQVPTYKYNGTRLHFLNTRFNTKLPISTAVSDTYEHANTVVKQAVDVNQHITYIDLAPAFCSKGECSQFLSKEFAYIDDNHLHVAASRKLSRFLQAELEK